MNKEIQKLKEEIEKKLTCPHCRKKLNKQWKCFHKENTKGIPLEYSISSDCLDDLQSQLQTWKQAIKEEIEFLSYELEIEKTIDWISELEYLRVLKAHIQGRLLELKGELKNE